MDELETDRTEAKRLAIALYDVLKNYLEAKGDWGPEKCDHGPFEVDRLRLRMRCYGNSSRGVFWEEDQRSWRMWFEVRGWVFLDCDDAKIYNQTVWSALATNARSGRSDEFDGNIAYFLEFGNWLYRQLARQAGMSDPDVDAVCLALQRVDFKDDFYIFLRAIDGDTIVVAPPRELRQWMKDVHVRLYGLEVPELWEPKGSLYRESLEQFCRAAAKSRLMIVWERERRGTNYEGFPLSSFERGIGHVFSPIGDGHFIYVNGLMHLLRESSLHRSGRSLLRGWKYVFSNREGLPWSGRCKTDIDRVCGAWQPDGDAWRRIARSRPPVCLLIYPAMPGLDPRTPDFEQQIADAILQQGNSGCPFERVIRQSILEHKSLVGMQRVSPFDMPLAYLSRWSKRRSM